MATVKTAISIQEKLFEEINHLAKEMQMPRSKLIALAVEEFINRRENRRIWAALNEVYADAPDSGDEALHKDMQRKHRRLVEGQW